MGKHKDFGFDIIFVLNRKSGKNITLAKGNQMISANDRMHFAVKMKITSYLRNLSYYQLSSLPFELNNWYSEEHPCKVDVTICPPTKRRMDPPNWYPTVKALIDGMTDAHLWTDDNKDVIHSMTFKVGQVTSDKKYHLIFRIKKDE